MVDSIVSPSIDKLSSLLINEAVLLHGVRDEVQQLKAELTWMESFLKDADALQEQNERVRTWVAQIRDLAYDVEDVIDIFIVKDASHRGHRGRSFYGMMKKLVSIFTKPSHLHRLGTQVQNIQTKLQHIRHSLETYDVKFEDKESTDMEASTSNEQLRRSYPHFQDNDDVVGLEDSIVEVVNQFLAEETGDKLRFVSLVGVGGIGKTTLAKIVYNFPWVKRHFDCFAWVFLSQNCFARNVLRNILTDVGENKELLNSLNENELCKRLFNLLQGKRYLVVLDDIWKKEDWDKIKQAFPRGKGSKILLTTRRRDVALHVDFKSSIIEPKLLTDEQSWELFNRKASWEWPIEFEQLGREMVRKCDGLPLAIVVLGGLLATKRSLREWKQVSRRIQLSPSLSKFQEQDHPSNTVMGILALSHNELPYSLKPCFLYLSHYPEDWEISAKELIRLWIAEGFISPAVEGEDIVMEDVGEEYLKKLIDRCLIQVSERDHTGRVKTCSIHDVLRDMCVSKAAEERFLGIIQSTETENEDYVFRLTTASNKPRRIAGHQGRTGGNDKGLVGLYVHDDTEKKCSKVRSIMLFQDERVVKLGIPNAFQLLRVLKVVKSSPDEQLSSGGQWIVPTEIGKLVLLRYLALESLHVVLPESIGNLKSLQTLRVNSVILPDVLFKLTCLRHLIIFYPSVWNIRIDTLENIITLRVIYAKSLIENNAMMKLTRIQTIGIIFLRSEEVEVILSNLSKLNRLHSLFILLQESVLHPNLRSLSQLDQLCKLHIEGEITEDLHRHHALEFLPQNISKLDLCGSKLKHDPIPFLEKLPQLRILKLRRQPYIGTKMVFSANGFPKLEELTLAVLHKIEEWEIQEDAMPQLKDLWIIDMPMLQIVPEGLRYVKTLQILHLNAMHLVRRIQVIDGKEGEDFYKVSHIPCIKIGTV